MDDQTPKPKAKRGRPHKPGGAMVGMYVRVPPATMEAWKAMGKDPKVLRKILVESLEYMRGQIGAPK